MRRATLFAPYVTAAVVLAGALGFSCAGCPPGTAASGEGEAAVGEGEGGEGEGVAGGEGEGEGEGEGAPEAHCANDLDVILPNTGDQAICGRENACNATTACDAGYTCSGTTCACTDYASCGVVCGAGGACPGAETCDPSTNQCFFDDLSCLTDVGCAQTEACRNSPAPDGHHCVARGTGVLGDACQSDSDCASATCVTNECVNVCTTNGDCAPGSLCTGTRLEATTCVVAANDPCGNLASGPVCVDGTSANEVCIGSQCEPYTCKTEADCVGNNCVFSIDGTFCRAEPARCGLQEIDYSARVSGTTSTDLCTREDRKCFTDADCADIANATCQTGFDPFFGSNGHDDGRVGYCAYLAP